MKMNGGNYVLCHCVMFVMEMNCKIINSDNKWRRRGNVAVALFFCSLLCSFLFPLGSLGSASDSTQLRTGLYLTGGLPWLMVFPHGRRYISQGYIWGTAPFTQAHLKLPAYFLIVDTS